MDIRLLENIGLTRNESTVYITLLKLGTSKTGEILKNSGLNSGKIYEILENLKAKGLVSESIINNTRHFTAAPPSQIRDYIKKKKEKLQEEEEIIETALPELEKLRESKIKELKAITYTGFKGIKTAAEEILDSLTSKDEILSMGVTKHKDKRFNEFWEKWSKKRIQKKINAKHLFSEKSEFLDIIKKMKYSEIRILSAFTPATVDIYGKDKVLILNYTEPYSCILIYDENTATSFKHFFNQLWKIGEK